MKRVPGQESHCISIYIFLYWMKQRRMNVATIRQIAKLANVSVSTVSRVLNNHPYVNEQKRAEILRVMEELNYTPNSNAVHLSKGKTNVIGISLPVMNNQYYSSILEGISKEAAKHDYHIMVCQTNNNASKEKEVLHMLKNKRMDGLILCSKLNDCSLIEQFATYAPIVTCEANVAPSVPSVHIDYYKTFKAGMDYLIQKGHAKIGYCIGRKSSHNTPHRKRAYIEGLQKIGTDFIQEWALEECLTIEDGKKVAKQLLQMKKRPTALLVSCNHIAASIRKELQSQGFRIPEDISIIGCDDQPIGEMFDVTTIASSSELIGKTAFTLLYENIMHETTNIKRVELPLQIIERTST